MTEAAAPFEPTALTRHIEERYHARHREQLPQLVAMAERWPFFQTLLTNLRMDPFERAEEENAMGYQRWYMERMFAIAPAGAYVCQWLQSFRDFPPRQKPGSFNLDRVMESVMSSRGLRRADRCTSSGGWGRILQKDAALFF